MSEETVLPKIVSTKNEAGTILCRIGIRNHEVSCDEQPLHGGNDEAPDPYDYIVAGIGSCTAVSLRQFAERKGWDIGDIEITLSYDVVDGEDVVVKEITFSGDLAPEQRTALLRVAHCPAQKMLERGMKIVNLPLVQRGSGQKGNSSE